MSNINKKYPDYYKPDYNKPISKQLEDQINRYNKTNNKQYGE